MTKDSSFSQVRPFPDTMSSVVSIVCRICYDCEKDEELITPCNCKGTVAFVHRTCLETWLGESNTTTCELCHKIFKTERTPKYTSSRSIWYWCRRSPAGAAHGVKNDILACTIITPLAIVITYVCLFSSEYYNQQKFSNVPAARWTSVSLLVMIAIMLIGYYMWVYSVTRMHARMWYNWWQRTCDVRYIPPPPQSGSNMVAARSSAANHNQTDADGNDSSVVNMLEGSEYALAPNIPNPNSDEGSSISALNSRETTVISEADALCNDDRPKNILISCVCKENVV